MGDLCLGRLVCCSLCCKLFWLVRLRVWWVLVWLVWCLFVLFNLLFIVLICFGLVGLW